MDDRQPAVQIPVAAEILAAHDLGIDVGDYMRMELMETTPELTDTEMLEILKAIARDGGNAAARIAAIKELRAINGGQKPDENLVQGLYDVANPGRIRTKAA